MRPRFDISETDDRDIPAISRLIADVFDTPLDDAYLRWMLTDPHAPGRYNSFVARADGTIVGHVGYVRARYRIGTGDSVRTVRGTHAIALCVNPAFRGGIGRTLFEQASSIEHISFIYEGTESAIRMYPKSGFRRFGHVFPYRTSLHSPSVGELLENRDIRRFSRDAALSVWDRLSRRTSVHTDHTDLNDIAMVPYEPRALETVHSVDGTLSNHPDDATIQWFRRCPIAESHVFIVHYRKQIAGPLFLYVNRRARYATARIHHVPNLGPDTHAWLALLDRVEHRVRELGCRSITLYATHPALRQALERIGYRNTVQRYVWLFDPDCYIDSASVHLTYFEGDHGFRGV